MVRRFLGVVKRSNRLQILRGTKISIVHSCFNIIGIQVKQQDADVMTMPQRAINKS